MPRLLAILLCALASGLVAPTPARADGCYLCARGSSCNQCRYGSKDDAKARKACEARGCKITGTASCSTAANVKVCVQPPASEKLQTAALQCAPSAVN